MDSEESVHMETDVSRVESATTSGPPRSQLVGIVVLGLLLILVFRLAGLFLAATSVFVFLDAWYAGIRKRLNEKGFLNISPFAWAMAIIFLFILSYPLYAFTRNRLRTREGKIGYWATVHVLGVLTLVTYGIQLMILWADLPPN